MRVIKCDICKKEIKEAVEIRGLHVKGENYVLDLDLLTGGETEICEPCRNRIIRKAIKENFPLEK